MIGKEWREALLCALCLTLLSWASVRAGIYLGERFVPPNPGYPQAGEVNADLFRFDSVYYKAIAESGYSYNEDPSGSPNIVFAPLFPLAVRLLSEIPGLDTVTAGFLLNKIFLIAALALLFLSLRLWFTREKTLLVLFALVTSAGSYSLHAFYSESSFLFFISLVIYFFARRKFVWTGVACGVLSLCRLTGVPVSVSFAFVFYILAWKSWAAQRKSRVAVPGGRTWSLMLASFLSLAGVVGYLGYLWIEFGNPFLLLPEIQQASWGRFHPPLQISSLFGGYLFSYWAAALAKGWLTFVDIQTLNLIWTTLGLASGVYLLANWRRHFTLSLVFLPYLLFIYYSNSSSEYLISAHRFFALMLPIYLMFAGLVTWIQGRWGRPAGWSAGALLLSVNIGYGLLHTAAFNQGVWFWF